MYVDSLYLLKNQLKQIQTGLFFEPNDEVLWVRVQRTISVFLTNLWRGGSLAGTSPEEAFFVHIGRDTMSQDDIDNGRLICVIGVAPVKPAEICNIPYFSENSRCRVIKLKHERSKYKWQAILRQN